MAHKLRKVALLGAFEIQGETEPPVRDGLILGSRREERGFVLEASRESIEQIVALAAAPTEGLPVRLAASLGKMLQALGHTLVRIELVPVASAEADPAEGYGAYVQGYLVFKGEGKRPYKLPMTATEAIQVAVAEGLTIMAAVDLLQLNVSQFLAEIDAISKQHHQETKQFHNFLDRVTASDFARFYESKGDGEGDEPA